MKKAVISFVLLLLRFFSASCYLASGQETSKVSPSLPDDVSKIVTFSCIPCHTSSGGYMSRSKLNFTEWTQYSTSKQKDRAEKMYSDLKKGKMPPKSARETKPEIIPTKDQIDIIKKWSESLQE